MGNHPRPAILEIPAFRPAKILSSIRLKNHVNFSTVKLTVALIILICLSAATYIYRNPTGDDAWFAEQSYWLKETGIVRSNFFTGVLDWDKQLLVSHKLFLAVGAALMALFGNNLVAVQFSGLIFFLIMVLEIGAYVYKREQSRSSFYLLAILILIFSNRVADQNELREPAGNDARCIRFRILSMP